MLFRLMLKMRDKLASQEVVPQDLVEVARHEGISLPDWYVESAQVGVHPSDNGMFGVGKGVKPARVRLVRKATTAE
jgi:hypothetical protein